MNHIAPVLDFKTMTAILTANPDGISMIGVWNGMKTLASADPEGCVRLNPGLPMDSAALASLFHCAVGIVEKTIAVFDKIHCLSVEDGLIRITGCGNSNGVSRNAVVSEEDKAKKREYNRLRKAAWREKQKQMKQNEPKPETEYKAESPETNAAATWDNVGNNACVPCDNAWNNPVVTCDTTCDTYDSVCDICDTACDTGTCDNNIYNNHINNKYTISALSADKHITNKYSSSSLSANKHIRVIPLKNLSETCQRVIREWNKLPLPKYKGLLPALAEKLKFLLQKYGEPTLLKTIAKIADSRFLLGKKGNSTWSASLAWLLEPDHFANVLSGKYQDDARRSGHKRNRDDWWEPGDPFPFYLPNEDMVAKEGLAALLKPITPEQKRAAQILGLPS